MQLIKKKKSLSLKLKHITTGIRNIRIIFFFFFCILLRYKLDMFSSWNMELGIHNNADMFTYVSTFYITKPQLKSLDNNN